SCTIGANFQFVALDQADADYQIKIDNDLGLDLYTGQAEMSFLDDSLSVGEQYGMLSLSDGSGLIDSAVGVNVYEPSTQTIKK
ncbi:iron-sulfur cluster biosynthesis family protein, partial [Lactobacillus delbrueckii]